MEFRRAFDIGRSLTNAWKLIQRAPGPLLVGGILFVIVSGHGGGGGWQFGRGSRALDDLWPLFVGLFGFACLVGIGLFLLSSWVQLGWLRSIEETARTGRTDFATVFGGGDRWISMVLVRFFAALILVLTVLPMLAIVGVAVFLHEGLDLPEELAGVFGVVGCLIYLPVLIYVALGVALAPYSLALEGLEPLDALKRSWALVQGNRLWLLLYGIVTAIVSLVGLLACCIGVVLTATWVTIAWTEAYLALVRPDDHGRWWISTGEAPRQPMTPSRPPPSGPPPTPGAPPAEPSFATPPPPPMGGSETTGESPGAPPPGTA